MTRGANEDLGTTIIVEELAKTVLDIVVNKRWTFAFRKNGFGPEPFARKSLLESLQWNSMPSFGSNLPNYEGFKSLFPRGTIMPFGNLLTPLPPRAGKQARRSAIVPVDAVPAEPVLENEPWSRRLRPRRSQSQLSLNLDHAVVADPASSSGAEACPPPPPPAETPPAPSTAGPLPLPRVARLGPPQPRSRTQLPESQP